MVTLLKSMQREADVPVHVKELIPVIEKRGKLFNPFLQKMFRTKTTDANNRVLFY